MGCPVTATTLRARLTLYRQTAPLKSFKLRSVKVFPVREGWGNSCELAPTRTAYWHCHWCSFPASVGWPARHNRDCWFTWATYVQSTPIMSAFHPLQNIPKHRPVTGAATAKIGLSSLSQRPRSQSFVTINLVQIREVFVSAKAKCLEQWRLKGRLLFQNAKVLRHPPSHLGKTIQERAARSQRGASLRWRST